MQAVYEANKDAFSAMADGLTEKNLTRFRNTAKAIPNMNLTKEAAAIKCSILVLGSVGDNVLSADASVQTAEITVENSTCTVESIHMQYMTKLLTLETE